MHDEKTHSADPFVLAEEMDFGDLHLKLDDASGLKAIVAIHSTALGPALGGCRFISYPSTQNATYDAMRLAQGMSYKAATAGLSLGGGKSVIIRPDNIRDRKKLFSAFGDFIEELGGRYITAVDSGTNVSDMDVIATRTQYVASTSAGGNNTGDPSPYTAFGVRRAIEAAVHHRLSKDNLDGIHVAIQGTGQVGYFLAKELHALGARLSFCDIDEQALARVKKEFGGDIVAPNNIYDIKCDVFAPCALGGAINNETIDRLQSPIVAGAANNQLSSSHIAQKLQAKDILYAPDYVANAGGLIQIALVDEDKVQQKISGIYEMMLSIFEQSKKTTKNSAETADNIAKEIIQAAGTRNASS